MKKCLRIRKSYYIYIILSFRNSHFIEEQERGRGWGRCKCKRKSRSCSETLTGNYVRHVTQWIPSQELATAQRQSNRHTDQLAPQIHLHRRGYVGVGAARSSPCIFERVHVMVHNVVGFCGDRCGCHVWYEAGSGAEAKLEPEPCES